METGRVSEPAVRTRVAAVDGGNITGAETQGDQAVQLRGAGDIDLGLIDAGRGAANIELDAAAEQLVVIAGKVKARR